MERKIDLFGEQWLSKEKIAEIFQGWNAYAKWGNGFNIRRKIFLEIVKNL